MSNSGSSQVDVFDVRKVRKLVELMNEHDLAEIDLRQGEQRIRLRRDSETVVTTVPSVPQTTLAPTAPIAASSESSSSPAPAEDANAILVKSPMVGTFYSAANPDSAPFVKVGDQVGPETTVCIVEAMKVFNEIPAECSGKIVAVLVETGDPVEFGQPLFKLQK
jgi:acetyl-CoA carboxylase biotin carboxyl carrier protein